ncbi:MAG TPA: universal stress protein [Chthoniobacterales bacterium]
MQTHSNEQPTEAIPRIAVPRPSIVCGTDFSEPAAKALEVAAAFAKHLNEPLVVVHAVNDKQQENLPGELRDSLALYARSQLHNEEERLRASQVELTQVLRAGLPHAVLLEESATHHARLLVLAAGKKRLLSRWLLGGVAERVAESTETPTLVVRDATPFLLWMQRKRRLRVLVGADFSAPSDAALRWVGWFQQLEPCDVVVAYLEPGLAPCAADDIYPPQLVAAEVLETLRMQKRHFRRRVRALLGRNHARVRFAEDWGRSDAHLIQLAAEERADLIVTGTHSRHGWQRLGHHSVSRGVLRYAPVNVACVPVRTSESVALPLYRHAIIHPSPP